MIKVKINAKQLLGTKERFQKIAREVFNDKELLGEASLVAIGSIKLRTRLRKMPDGSQIKKLSRFTIEKRKELSSNGKNKTHGSFEASKSNLTFTGQFLDSLSAKINERLASFSLFFDGVHEPYKSKDGKNEGKRISNNEIYKKQKEFGRSVLVLNPDKKFYSRVTILARNALRRRLSQFRKK